MAATLLCMSLSSVCYCQVHIAVTSMFCQVYVIVKCEMFINFNYIMYMLLSCVISYVTLKYTLLSCARVRVCACARVRVCACALWVGGWVGGWVVGLVGGWVGVCCCRLCYNRARVTVMRVLL